VRRRLAVLRHVEEVSGNVAMTCRYFGISRQLYYVWLRRYRDEGVDGLRDRSRRPKVSPRATPVEVVEKILYLDRRRPRVRAEPPPRPLRTRRRRPGTPTT
jgi:transposase-like protein